MIEVENTDVIIVRNLVPMRNLMPASAYGLKAISDWFFLTLLTCVRMYLWNIYAALHVPRIRRKRSHGSSLLLIAVFKAKTSS